MYILFFIITLINIEGAIFNKTNMADQTTILDIEKEIREELQEELNKNQINKLKELKRKRIKTKKYNYKQGAKKRKLRKRLENKGISEKKIKKELNKIPTYPLKRIDNKIQRITKKDFYLFVDDRFTDPYKIKISDIGKTRNIGAKILKKANEEISKYISKEEKEKNKKLVEILKRIKDVILWNLQIIKSGIKIYPESDPKKGEYPIYVDIIGDTIILQYGA